MLRRTCPGLALVCLSFAIALPALTQAGIGGGIACGGIVGGQCPEGTTCVDTPSDGCSPSCGGADCGGFCAEVPPVILCGGIAQIPCPGGLTCVDAPDDKCVPDCGGADCPGVCVFAEGVTCAGFAGLQCPAGFTCVDASGDSCHPGCGGADCSGTCIQEVSPFCGGIASIPCPAGLVCVDDPGDACDTDCGGADCSGICVDPVGGCDGATPGPVLELRWDSGQSMAWDQVPCAQSYNCYRLTAHSLADLDGDGLAESYGACLDAGLPSASSVDDSDPPASFTHFYIVTAASPTGEGPMGNNSLDMPRPNQAPCE